MDLIIAYISLGVFLGVLAGIIIVNPDFRLIATLIGDGIVAAIAYVIFPEGVFGYGIGLLIGFFAGIALKIILDRHRTRFDSTRAFWNPDALLFFIFIYSVAIILVIFVFPSL